MTPPSIPVSQPPARAQSGPKQAEANGVPGLFEQIQQGLQNQSQPATGQASTPANQHKTTQCHDKKVTQKDQPEEQAVEAPAQPAVQDTLDLTDASPTIEAEQAPVTAEPLDTQDPVLQLAAQTTDAAVTKEGLTPSGDSKAGNTANAANPLAKAIQVVQNLQTKNSQPVEVVGTTGSPDNAQPLPAQANLKQLPVAPGLSQASQQLDTNLLRWTSKQQAAVETISTGQSATSASSISSLLTNQTPSTGPATVPRFDVPGNIQQPAWQQAVAERVVMIQHQNIQQAELKLHPAELGPVSVRLESLQDGATKQTSVQFAATHADTREALEAALPRLREMFNQQGMNLVRADIQQQFQQPGGQQDQPQAATSQSLGGEAGTAENSEHSIRRRIHSDNLLDLYV